MTIKLFGKLKYIIIVFGVIFFLNGYFVNHRLFNRSLLEGVTGGVIITLLSSLFFKFDLLSKIFQFVSVMFRRKKIDTIQKYLDANGIITRVIQNRIDLAIDQKKISITVWISSLEIFFEFDNPGKSIPINNSEQHSVERLVPFKNGVLVLLKRRVSEYDIYHAVNSFQW